MLESSYALLNQTYTALQNEIENMINRISSSENALNVDRVVMFIFIAAVASLIALVIYLKRKEPEPYVVIRKETVALEQEEKQ
jgi:type IV secretory pathway component VirB8